MTGIAAFLALALAASAPEGPLPPAAESAREQLNDAQAEKARQQVGENFAREDNYAEAVKRREAEIKRQNDAYAAAIAQHSAQEAAYQQAMVVWRAEACRLGHKLHCPAKN